MDYASVLFSLVLILEVKLTNNIFLLSTNCLSLFIEFHLLVLDLSNTFASKSSTNFEGTMACQFSFGKSEMSRSYANMLLRLGLNYCAKISSVYGH